MSTEEKQAIIEKQDKSILDIRRIKVAMPILMLIPFAIAIWEASSYWTDLKNERKTEMSDLKSYISRVKDSIVTVTSIKITSCTNNFNRKLDSVVEKQNDKIERLPGRFRNKMPATYGERYHYDPAGNRIVTAVPNN